MSDVKIEAKTREQSFVDSIMKRCQNDKGLASRLKNAVNPALEYQSWEILAGYGINLERLPERQRFALIASSIASAKINKEGSMTFGKALADAYPEGPKSNSAKAKMRRLLACHDIEEACKVLRPMIRLIQSRVSAPFNHSRLLGQLRSFEFDSQRIKAQWAQEFYSVSFNIKDTEAVST
jgi:CRISPR system Cascade subunit CasB